MRCRLQNSEQQSKQSDQSDKDMRMELEGKVDDLQKQLTDLDTLRLTPAHTHARTNLFRSPFFEVMLGLYYSLEGF